MSEPLRKHVEYVRNQPPRPELRIYHGQDQHGRGWLWLLIIVVIAGLAVWGISRSQAARPPQPVAMSNAATSPTHPPLDVPTLLSNKDTYLGKAVHLRDVLVQSVNDEHVIFVGPSAARQVLVILKPGAVPDTLQGKAQNIPRGGIVTITGTAEKAGSAADLERSARVSHNVAKRVSHQGVVVQADRVEPQTM